MDGGFDGEVKIGATLDADGVTNGLERLKRAMRLTGKDLDSISGELAKELGADASKIKATLEKMIDEKALAASSKKAADSITKNVKSATKEIDKEAKKAAEAQKKIAAATKKTGDNLKELGGIIGGNTGTFLGGVGDLISGGGLTSVSGLGAAVTAINAIRDGIRECTEVYKIQEKAELSLQAAAMNNPYLNNDGVERLKRFASTLQENSNIGDEVSIRLMSQLASAGRTEDEIQKIMTAATDLSASGLMDMSSAVHQLNMTYSGMAGTLGRQIGAIKDLTAEQLAHGEAVDIVAKKYKGLAAANLDANTQANNAWGDMIENIGKSFKPLQDAMDRLKKGFSESAGAIINAITKLVTDSGTKDGTFKGYEKQRKALESVVDKCKDSSEALDVLNDKLIEADNGNGKNSAQLKEHLKGLGLLIEKTDEYGRVILTATANATAKERTIIEALERELRARDNLNKKAAVKDKAAASAKNKTRDDIPKLEARVKELEGLANKAWERYINTQGTATGDIFKKTYDTLSKELISENALLNATREKVEKEDAEHAKKAAALSKASNADLAKALKQAKDMASAKGQEVTHQTKLNILEENYKKLLEAGAGVLTGEDAIVKERVNAIKSEKDAIDSMAQKEGARKAAEKDLLTAMKEAQKVIAETEGRVTDKTKTELELLVDEYKKIASEIKDISDEALDELNKKNGTSYTKENLRDTLDAGQVELEKEKIAELTRLKDDEFKEYDERLHNLAIATKEINLSEIMDAKDKAEQLEAIHAAMEETNTQKTKAEIESRMLASQKMVDMVGSTFSNVSNAINSTCDLYLDLVNSQRDADLAALEDSYDKGEKSEEEYQKKKKEIQKKAAQDEYAAKMAEWTNSIIMAQAQTAQAIIGALADTSAPVALKIVNAALIGAMGAMQLGQIIANKPIKPSFARGGIVPGNSYKGDRVQVNANSGEMILTRGQQRQLWEIANGERQESGGDIYINNTQSDRVGTRQRRDPNGDTYIDIIDRHINDGFKKGVFDEGYNGLLTAREGDRYY